MIDSGPVTYVLFATSHACFTAVSRRPDQFLGVTALAAVNQMDCRDCPATDDLLPDTAIIDIISLRLRDFPYEDDTDIIA